MSVLTDLSLEKLISLVNNASEHGMAGTPAYYAIKQEIADRYQAEDEKAAKEEEGQHDNSWFHEFYGKGASASVERSEKVTIYV